MASSFIQRQEARSIALHVAVAEKLWERPELLEAARARVLDWLEDGSVAAPYARAWQVVLSQPLDLVTQALVRDDQEMADLRQVSPFAGVLDPRTRWAVLKSVESA